MKLAIGIAVLADLTTGASVSSCSAGYKHKEVLTGLLCDDAATDAASCNTNCCQLDDSTCGGLSASVVCEAGSYKGDTAFTADTPQATKDKWAKRTATSASKNIDCCHPRATCASQAYRCPAGQKRVAGSTAVCTTDAKSCAKLPACCIPDAYTCGGSKAQTCGAGTKRASDDAWKSTVIVDTNADGTISPGEWKSSCCGVLPTCKSASFSCPAGLKLSGKDDPCSGFDASKDCPSACCIRDTSTCGGLAFSCPQGKFKAPGSATLTATPASAEKICCTTTATCKVATCSAGMKKKAGVENVSCLSDADSCASSTCCETDPATCGGLFGIVCDHGFYNENLAWTVDTKQATIDAWRRKPATEKTKNIDCCTKRAVCLAPPSTAAVLAATTTTPALNTVMKYSQHRIATGQVKTKTGVSASLLFVGMGLFVGLGVFLIAKSGQHRSSRIGATSSREGRNGLFQEFAAE